MKRLLCNLGFHRWDYRTTYAHLSPISFELPYTEESCSRCSAVRQGEGS